MEKSKIPRNQIYYHLAQEGSKDLTHPSIKVLNSLFQESLSILDMGCGEGTRLNTLSKNTNHKIKKLFGIDENSTAINMAKRKYPEINFIKGDLVKLPFNDNEFDLLYSSYVFEHLIKPEIVIKEAIRVLKKNGKLFIVAPNFGAPNRKSPNSKENKIIKLVGGFLWDIGLLFNKSCKSLNWKRVRPIKYEYTIDSDTTIEPYLLSLAKFCQSLNFSIAYISSTWVIDKFSLFQFPFRILGLLRIYPFVFWGPHLCIVLKK